MQKQTPAHLIRSRYYLVDCCNVACLIRRSNFEFRIHVRKNRLNLIRKSSRESIHLVELEMFPFIKEMQFSAFANDQVGVALSGYILMLGLRKEKEMKQRKIV